MPICRVDVEKPRDVVLGACGLMDQRQRLRIAFEILEEFTERRQRILVVIGLLGRLCTAALSQLPALLPPGAILFARV